MKITMEQSDGAEIEVIIRGNLTDPKVQKLIARIQESEGISKLFLYRDDREFLHNAEEIHFFEAEDNRVLAHLSGETLETKYKLYELETLLAKMGFVRINKGVILNINELRAVDAEFSGNCTAILRNSDRRLVISRKYLKSFREFILEA